MLDKIKEKVPAYVKETPEWRVFLKWFKENKIQSYAGLKSLMKFQIREYQSNLEKTKSSREGTNNRVLRSIAKKLDVLKLIQTKIVKYL